MTPQPRHTPSPQQRWADFGVAPELAMALLGQGRCLVGAGRPHEAAAPLTRALALATTLRAASVRREIDALLTGLATPTP